MPTSHAQLQVTFLPAEGAFAWWGPPDPATRLAEAGLPVGRDAVVRLARPAGDRITVVDTAARLVDLGEGVPALANTDGELSPSARVWREAARRLDEDVDLAMPPAAHAVPNAEGTAVLAPAAVLRRFREAARTSDVLRGAIQAQLRPYQVAGVAWLRGLDGGGVLADEMGLGKTLQAIGLLATRPGPHLVVCPTSLVGNWQRELARFAPGLAVVVHHGARRRLGDLAGGPVVVTSYGALRTDAEALAAVDWTAVVLDEAQQIKNPDAQASRAAARLRGRTRVALTGTPVENRLDDLWAILHATHPGLLGTRARFRQRFTVPIQQRRSATATARLHTLLAPHLLRRTKAGVAADLPPKVHATVYCTLTAEQVRLYREAVDRAFGNGLGTGIARRGNVLALLTALKQVCNHPAQLLGQDGPLPGRSGKFDRVTEMLTEIVEDNDRALVFTQYRVMGDLLAAHLAEVLGRPVPFLHGGLSAKRRDSLVHAFQEDGPPVLLLSLRAAGFGLNLTRAGHVVHYDRWWNPAVEAQATDRAHRIGQHRVLNVHTLVTGGTLEEHIARMHEAKRALADVVAGRGEAALADLPDEDLYDLLALDAEAGR